MSAAYARQLLKKFKVREPKDIDLGRIAADLKITIEEEQLEGCDGMLQMRVEPKRGIITVKKSIRELGQKRFIIAHEIGHYESPILPGLAYSCTSADLSLDNQRIKPEERAANRFAAELLMPKFLFLPRLAGKRPDLELVKDLASEFKTTLTATLRRFVEHTDSRCALVISENRKIKYCIPSKEFGFSIQQGAPVDGNSFAIDFFNFGYLDGQMKSVRANAWIKDPKLDDHVWIKEQSIAQRRYNSVLTLLWVE
jgi:hypothetical protein